MTERKIYLDFSPAILEMTNFEELKSEVEKYAEKYRGLVFTRDEKLGASQARSELKALYDAIENERKNVKSVYNKPLQEFEQQIKSLTDLINGPLNDIREGLKVIEEAEKQEREDALNILLEDKLSAVDISIDTIQKQDKWLNKGNWTAKLNPTAKLEAEIDLAVEIALKEKKRKETEVKILTEFCKAQDIEPAGWISQLEFKSAMEIIDLINLERQRKERLQKEQEERQKQHEEFLSKQAKELEETQKFAEQEVEISSPELFSSTIQVTGTADQLNALNDFLIKSGIQVEEVSEKELPTKEDVEEYLLDDVPW